MYQVIKRVLPLDVTHLLWVNRDTVTGLQPRADYTIRPLGNDDLQDLAAQHQFNVSDALAADCEHDGIVAIGAFQRGKLVATSFFAADRVAARHNRGSTAFEGIGLLLPADTRYLFKSFVDPAHRGQHLNARIALFALEHFGTSGPTSAIVTATDISNAPFLSSAARLGFKRCGIAAEWVFRGRHHFKLPAPIDARTGAIVSHSRAAIRLVVERASDLNQRGQTP
ncbi:MAG: hypothetical protein AAF460_10805 [Pseudomonadota bacterium]